MRKLLVRGTISIALSAAACSCGLGQSITEFPIPRPSTGPAAITAGPDGALWFTEQDFDNGRKIGRIDLSGTITEYSIPGSNPIPTAIVAGPDGALWFADYGDGQISRMTTLGAITSFSLPVEATYSSIGIAFGSDGNLWFTMSAAGKIGRMTPQGSFSEFPLPVDGNPRFPTAIVEGSDGNLWFCDLEARSVGRMSTAGSLTDFPLPSGVNPISITVGPDGAVWVGCNGFGGAIFRVTPAGEFHRFDLPAPFLDPIGLARGSDGAVWFVDDTANRVGRLTPEGTLTWLDIPSSNGTGSYPAAITRGSDGNLWFTENGDDQIARVSGGLVAVPAVDWRGVLVLVAALALIGVAKSR